MHIDVTIINLEFVLGTLPYPKVCIIFSELRILEGCSDKVQVVTEDNALESFIFVIQKVALHQNWVEFCKSSIGFVSTSLSMS